jgi:hypothetical protein
MKWRRSRKKSCDAAEKHSFSAHRTAEPKKEYLNGLGRRRSRMKVLDLPGKA